MTTKFPQAIARAALAVALLSPVFPVMAQTPAPGSSARNIQTVSDRADVVAQQLVAKAEDHYKQGLLNLREKVETKP